MSDTEPESVAGPESSEQEKILNGEMQQLTITDSTPSAIGSNTSEGKGAPIIASPSQDPVTSWDVERMAVWMGSFFEDPQLRQTRMEDVRRNLVTGEDEELFASVDLMKELIPEIGPRIRIMRAYRQLQARRPITTPNYQVLVSSREGVAFLDPLVSRRVETCERLDNVLEKKGAVLIRSPPFSGKTSLAELFYLHLVQRNERVIRVSFLGLRDLLQFDEFWKSQCGGESWEAHLLSRERCTIILDEAQFIYPLGQSHPFWNAIKLALSAQMEKWTKSRVLVFAAFGEKPDHQVNAYATTPVDFGVMLDLKDMQFTRSEYNELMDNYAATAEAARLSIGVDAQEAIWNATWGHPGLVRLCIDKIRDHLLPIVRGDTSVAVKDHSAAIIQYLMSHDFFVALKGTRACLRQVISDKAKAFLLALLDSPDGISPDDGFPEELIASGLVGFHTETRVQLAAPLFRGILIQRFFSSPRPLHTNCSFEEFIKLTIRGMDPTMLQKSLSRHSQGAPLYERHWQMEFYRVATSLLSSKHTISPEVGKIFGVPGFLDFYVNGDLRWGIEFMREGIREEEHARRFRPRGTYRNLVKNHLAQYALLDFRAQGNTKPFGTDEHFWDLIYSNDFREVTLRRHNHPDEKLLLNVRPCVPGKDGDA